MAREARLFRPYRQAAVVSGGALAVMVALAIGLSLAGPSAGRLTGALTMMAVPAGLLSLLLLTAALLASGLRAATPPAGSTLAAEEPLLMAPHLPLIQRDAPLVLVLGGVSKAGATILSTSLALLVAEEGCSSQDSSRRARSLLLLECPGVADRNGQPGWLSDYLMEHPTTIRDDVIELTTRHQSGAEVLRVGAGEMNALQLRDLLSVFRKHYDLIVLDAMAEDHRLTQAAIELADAIVLVIPDRLDGIQAMGRWAERVYGLGVEGRSILAVTRRQAPESAVPSAPFLYGFELPEQSRVTEPGLALLCWAPRSAANRQLRKAARMLLPRLLAGVRS